MITSYADRNTLAACLRVSKSFFHLAGRKLYTRIEVDPDFGWTEMLEGAVPHGSAENEGRVGVEASQPQTTNYKRQLLGYVETIAIGDHYCRPEDSAKAISLVKTYGMLSRIKKMILTSWPDCMPDQNDDYDDDEAFARDNDLWCMFAGLLKYESLTLHDCPLDTLLRGYDMEPFTASLDIAQHVTLVVSPKPSFLEYCGPTVDKPHLLPLVLESFRLILADYRFEMTNAPAPDLLVSTDVLIKSLAPYLKLAKWKIEIYIFNDFDNTFDLIDFREKLKIEVDDAIKALPEKERPDRTPDYQVYGLEDYFNHPDMYLELDHK